MNINLLRVQLLIEAANILNEAKSTHGNDNDLDISHLDNDFKKKSGRNFVYYDIDSEKGKKYLKTDDRCNENIKFIHKNYRGEIAVDTKDDTLAGYIFINKNKQDGYIQPLFIFKKYRGYGLSNKLLDDAIKKYNATGLSVYKYNEIAIRLYKKHGFVIVGDNGNDVYYMRLGIN